MKWVKWVLKHEPVVLGGVLAGVGVYLGIRYGAHVNGATQIFPGISVAAFVAFLSRFVGPSAVSDIQGIANDVESIKGQLAPLKGLKWQNAVGYIANHGKEVMAIIEAAKTDVEDLLGKNKKLVPFEPPVSTGSAVADLAKLTAAQPGLQPAAAPAATATPGT